MLSGASVKTAASFSVTHRKTANQTGKYEFTIVPGLSIKKDETDPEKRQKTRISKITFRGDELAKGTMWSERTDGSGNYVVTVEEKAFDAAFFKPDTKLNTSYPIVIEILPLSSSNTTGSVRLVLSAGNCNAFRSRLLNVIVISLPPPRIAVLNTVPFQLILLTATPSFEKVNLITTAVL